MIALRNYLTFMMNKSIPSSQALKSIDFDILEYQPKDLCYTTIDRAEILINEERSDNIE